MREATEIALSSFYRPLAAAKEGASLGQVKALIEISRTQFETYMSLAISRCQKQLDLDKEKEHREIENSLDAQKPVKGLISGNTPRACMPRPPIIGGERVTAFSNRQQGSSFQDGESTKIEGIRFEDEEL